MTELLCGGGAGRPLAAWLSHVEAATADRASALDWLRRLDEALARAARPERIKRWAASPAPHMSRRVEHGLLRIVAGMVAVLAGLSVLAAAFPAHRGMSDLAGATLDQPPLSPEELAAALIPAFAPRGLPGARDARPVQPVIPSARGALPVGKGMWMWKPEASEGGNPEAVVIRAKAAGLTHLYVRTGSSKMGFYSQQYLNDLLPRAHAAGIRVFGWDFPYLFDVGADVARGMAAITHRTPGGHRIDGFAADIETRGEGVNLTPEGAAAYGTALRRSVGTGYPLIAVVPRPSAALITYPFRHVVATFDAVAPMVYWMKRDPGSDVAGAINALRVLGKPIIPVGQAYDGFGEGGNLGVPSRGEIQRFMSVAEDHGAIGVSFWSWQHASQEAWDAIRDAPQFTLPATPVGEKVGFTPGQIRIYQALLTSLGFPAPVTGAWDERTANALRAYQEAARLPATGVVDHATLSVLLTPFAAPISPLP